jgi:hypothetical protein
MSERLKRMSVRFSTLRITSGELKSKAKPRNTKPKKETDASELGRLCCKSRRHLVRSPKTGNIRIRRGEFLNQNSLFGLDLEKVFFPPGLKIVLQHYRPPTSEN